MAKADFKKYGKRFVSITGILGALCTALPFLSLGLSDQIAELVFPPLGSLALLGRIGATGFSLLITLIVYHVWKEDPPQTFGKRVSILSFISFACFLGYFAMYESFVCKNYVRDKKMSVAVSIGYKRTPDAAIFKDKSDTEILQERGFEEAEIQKYWTGNSILIVRIGLLLTYTGIIASVVGVLSFTALREVLES